MAGISVNIDPVTAGQVEMQFLTCSAVLPSKPGLFFMSPSCGSGKSTAIAKLAAMSKDGVLIVVQTIADAIEMRRRVMAEGQAGSDICALYSQDFCIIEKYRNDPMSFTNTPTLIITSARIQIDPIRPFLSFRGGTRKSVFVD